MVPSLPPSLRPSPFIFLPSPVFRNSPFLSFPPHSMSRKGENKGKEEEYNRSLIPSSLLPLVSLFFKTLLFQI